MASSLPRCDFTPAAVAPLILFPSKGALLRLPCAKSISACSIRSLAALKLAQESPSPRFHHRAGDPPTLSFHRHSSPCNGQARSFSTLTKSLSSPPPPSTRRRDGTSPRPSRPLPRLTGALFLLFLFQNTTEMAQPGVQSLKARLPAPMAARWKSDMC